MVVAGDKVPSDWRRRARTEHRVSGVEGGRRTATIERFAVIYVDLRNYSLDPVCYCAIVEWTRKFEDGVCSWFRRSLASAHRIVQPNESKKLDRAEPLLRSIEETPGAQRKMFKLFRQSLAPVPGDFIQGGAVLESRECARHRYFPTCSSSQNFKNVTVLLRNRKRMKECE